MKQRTVTTVIALILFIPIVVAGGYWIDWLAAALAAVGISEIFLTKKQVLLSVDFLLTLLATLTWTVPRTLFSVSPKEVTRPEIYFTMVMLPLAWTVLSKSKTSFDDVGTYTLASLYIGTGFHYLAAIRDIDHGSVLGLALLGYVFAVAWSTDTGAYMIGKKFGKHKLWPVISPNKTWEGSIGAVACAIAFSAIYINVIPLVKDYSYLIWTSAILSIVGQVGDLVESAYKRYYGVKDSGKTLPGHGGILDRLDSMLSVLPVIALFFTKG